MNDKRERALRLALEQKPGLIDKIIEEFAAPKYSAQWINEQVAHLVRKHRERRKMTQGALSDRIGKSRTSVVHMEAGKQAISLLMLYRIASALNVPVADLLPPIKQE